VSGLTCPLAEACPGVRCPLGGSGGETAIVLLRKHDVALRPEAVARGLLEVLDALLEAHGATSAALLIRPLGAEGVDRALLAVDGHPVAALELAGWLRPLPVVRGLGAEVLAARIRAALRTHAHDAWVDRAIPYWRGWDPVGALHGLVALADLLRGRGELTPARRARLADEVGRIKGRLWTGAGSN
jgi:hypothetical protein